MSNPTLAQVFQDYNPSNPITAAWLNAVGAICNNNLQIPVAAARFNGATAAIVQSNGVASIVRNSAGNYTVTLSQALDQSANVYAITTNILGFNVILSETTSSLTFECTNNAGTPTDPTAVSLVVWGSTA